MSKIFVDQIQKSGGPALTLPNNLPNGKQYLATDVNGNLTWATPPTLKQAVSLTPTNSSPILFAQWANYTNGFHSGNGATFSSEIGPAYQNGNIQLGLLTGRTTEGKGAYRQYVIPPKIHYAIGSRGGFHYADEEGGVYGDTSNKYNYPDRMLIALFIKNKTLSDITTSVYFRYSSYWNSGYEGAGVFSFVPDATNTQIQANSASITSVATTTLVSYTSNTTAAVSGPNVLIPADKTVAVLLSCTPYYYASSSGYQYRKGAQIYDLYSSTLSNSGLEIDIARTNRALANPLKSSELIDIWK